MNMLKWSREKKKGLLFHMHSLLFSICFDLLFGLLLVFLKDTALMIAAYVLSGFLVICGVFQVMIYLRSPVIRKIVESRLAAGLILLLSGTMLLFNPAFLQDIFPVIWGLSLLAGAFLKIQYAFDLAQLKIRKWWIMLILASLSLVIGILALLRPDFMGESKDFVIGLMLVFEAVLDIVVLFLMNRALKRNFPGEAGSPESSGKGKPAADAHGSSKTDAQPDESENEPFQEIKTGKTEIENPEKAPVSKQNNGDTQE